MAKNHEQRVIQSFGPKFRIDVNSTLVGQKGTNVYLLYAVTDDNSTQFQALDESGRFMLHNEKDIEIVAGPKLKGDVGIDIKTLKGNIEITCQGDGSVLIKGSNVVVVVIVIAVPTVALADLKLSCGVSYIIASFPECDAPVIFTPFGIM